MLVENRLHSFYRMIHVAAAAGTAMFLSFFSVDEPSIIRNIREAISLATTKNRAIAGHEGGGD